MNTCRGFIPRPLYWSASPPTRLHFLGLLFSLLLWLLLWQGKCLTFTLPYSINWGWVLMGSALYLCHMDAILPVDAWKRLLCCANHAVFVLAMWLTRAEQGTEMINRWPFHHMVFKIACISYTHASSHSVNYSLQIHISSILYMLLMWVFNPLTLCLCLYIHMYTGNFQWTATTKTRHMCL